MLWGSASSAYQIEGAYQKDGKGISIWDTYANFPGNTFNNTNGNIACDHYHRYKEDISLMKEMGLETYRFSISWTRIMPNGRDINEKGIQFYKNLCEELIKNNIQPIVTLYHWDLPQALQDEYQGWESRQILKDFINYVTVCFHEFHFYVKTWIVLNEPNIFTELGYLLEKHPPKKNDINLYLKTFHHTAIAHALTIIKFKELGYEGIIGSSIAYTPSYANTKEDTKALEYFKAFTTDWYMESYYLGQYPTLALDIYKSNNIQLEFYDVDFEFMKKASQLVDFIGINYYQSACITYDEKHGYKYVKDKTKEYTPWNWVIDPSGLTQALKEIYEKYHLPILISENGLGAFDFLENNQIHDTYRIDYLRKHIQAIQASNVPVLAYCTWSFTDLLSWLNGYEKRYGFVYIDFDHDLKRIKKDSFSWYKKVIQTNGEEL